MKSTQIAVAAALSLAALTSTASAQQQMRFRGMDGDRDGRITRAEWRGNARAFDRHDVNNDGVLSGTEVRLDDGDGVLRDFSRVDLDGNGHVTAQEWRRAFADLDTNRDGSLTEDELWTIRTEAAQPNLNQQPNVNQRSAAFRAGYERGQTDGRQAGWEDDRRRVWDLDGQRELERADAGYRQELGSRQEYQAGYREGFRRGYAEGFGPR
jgi:Ca2+-binding EF-hand superfamily protein